ncbi:hypothetical protein O181_071769 [Austropuccinia psidii MF-1]|uniref:Integrase catalytic domain-containing protein n=1 Tax=Austropuccinia psidii MF-1 TaxID=1389203 RepID=A0A9Q3F3V3_9BASI|nr:hypothetical protein [Austropuccinia psidii MF-1]
MSKGKQEYRQEIWTYDPYLRTKISLGSFSLGLVTALPPSGDRSYNACLVIVDSYSQTPILLPCHKDDTAMDTALLLWSRVISHTGL